MQSLLRSLSKPHYHHHHHHHHIHQRHHRSLVDFAAIKHVKDRGFDHAVEREKYLKPVLNIKNLIKVEPSKSLPLTAITEQKGSLKIPVRPIELIRRYPSIFQEFLPGGTGVLPHIKLTQQVLDIDSDEQIIYRSEDYKNDVANRLLKLLMITRIDKIPLKILDFITWDLGLPQDYVKSIVPEFPDYFRVIGDKGLANGFESNVGLELVCWSAELAVSAMEKKAKSGETGYVEGMPLQFPMQFSKGFVVDKGLKKWFSDWQKLPYVSPYENAMHLGPSTDESDRWAVGVLHELLSLFVSKKVERDTLLGLGEWLGIRSRFKRALLHHPGIFYLSSKIGTYTVVLKEGYKRGFLVEKNPLVDIRNQYIHLMNTVVEGHKSISVPGGSKQQEKKTDGKSAGQGEKEDPKDNVQVNDLESDFEDDSDDGYEYEDDEEGEEGEIRTYVRRNVPPSRETVDKKKNLNVRGCSRNAGREAGFVEQHDKTRDEVIATDDYKYEEGENKTHSHRNAPISRGRGDKNNNQDSRGRSRNTGRERGIEKHHGKRRDKVVPKDEYEYEDDGENKRRAHRNAPSNRGRGDNNKNLDLRGHSRNTGREREIEKHHGERRDEVVPKDDYEYEEEGENRRAHKHASSSRRRGDKNMNRDLREHSRNAGKEREFETHHCNTRDKVLPKDCSIKETSKGRSFHERSQERSKFPKSKWKSFI